MYDFWLTLSIGYAAVTGDKLLDCAERPVLRAVTDSTTHGLIGLLSWALVVLKHKGAKALLCGKLCEILSAGFIASAIDVDHFVMARSFSLTSAMHLGEKRPILHCTTLWMVIVLCFFVTSKVGGFGWLTRLGWLTSVSILSHHIRDGTRRGLWLWPVRHTPPIPYPIYILSLMGLPHFISYLINFFEPLRPESIFQSDVTHV